MFTMEKSRVLYEMMAERMENESREKYQAAIYREILDMMKKYDDVEAFAADLQKSPLYLAPSQALVKDKCAAYKEAATERKMVDVAKIYEDKINELEEKPENYVDPSFYISANKLKEKYLEKMDDFKNIYTNYYSIKMCQSGSEDEYEKDLREAFDSIEKNNGLGYYDGDFVAVSNLKEFRNMIDISDEAYNKFVEEANSFRENSPRHDEEFKKSAIDVEKEFEAIVNKKSEVMAAGEKTMKKMKYALEIYEPPKNKDGKYEYVFEEVREFE